MPPIGTGQALRVNKDGYMCDESQDKAPASDPAKEDTLRRQKQFDDYWTEQQTRERANSDKYDNTILAYSTGALGLSITFIKDLVPLATAHHLWAIKVSWLLFAVSLLLMLASFPIAAESNRQSIEFAHAYFIKGDETCFNKQGWAAKILGWINPLAGVAFFAAAMFTVVFVWANIHEKEQVIMSEKQTPPTTKPSLLREGVGSASMQQVHKGTQSAAMAPAPAPTPAPAPAPAPAKPK